MQCEPKTLLVQKNYPQTLTCNGDNYTIEVLGGNPDENSALLRVNTETRKVFEGQSKTFDGLHVTIDNISIGYNEDVFVTLLIDDCCEQEVPEFGLIAGAIALIGALGIFIIKRRH